MRAAVYKQHIEPFRSKFLQISDRTETAEEEAESDQVRSAYYSRLPSWCLLYDSVQTGIQAILRRNQLTNI